MSIWTILFGAIVLFVLVSVVMFVVSVVAGVKHRNDPDPPLSGWDR